jgi:hypothetical protein
MPFNVLNKTIYLIYSLNNLCLLSVSLTKKKNSIIALLTLFTELTRQSICMPVKKVLQMTVKIQYVTKWNTQIKGWSGLKGSHQCPHNHLFSLVPHWSCWQASLIQACIPHTCAFNTHILVSHDGLITSTMHKN